MMCVLDLFSERMQSTVSIFFFFWLWIHVCHGVFVYEYMLFGVFDFEYMHVWTLKCLHKECVLFKADHWTFLEMLAVGFIIVCSWASSQPVFGGSWYLFHPCFSCRLVADIFPLTLSPTVYGNVELGEHRVVGHRTVPKWWIHFKHRTSRRFFFFFNASTLNGNGKDKNLLQLA